MDLSRLLQFFSVSPTPVHQILKEISNVSEDEWKEKLTVAPFSGLIFLHALMLEVISLKDVGIQKKILQDIAEKASANAWDIVSSPRLVRSGGLPSTARNCLTLLWNAQNDPELLLVLMKVLARIPAEKWHAETEGYIKAATALLISTPEVFICAQFFKFLAFHSVETDLWLRGTSVRYGKGEISISPMSALITILSANLTFVDKDDRAKPICMELMRALAKICEKSRDTDWEPLLTESASESVLNLLLDLILAHPKNATLNFIVKQVLEKASIEAINAVSADKKTRLHDQQLFDVLDILKKRSPAVSVCPSSSSTEVAIEGSSISSYSSNSDTRVVNRNVVNTFVDVCAQHQKRSSAIALYRDEVKFRCLSVKGFMNNPYSFCSSRIWVNVKKEVKRSSLAIAFDPMGHFS